MPRKATMTAEEIKESRRESVRKYNATHAAENAQYQKDKYKTFLLRFSASTEQDMIAHLAGQDSANSYIKNLIRQDMENTPS